MNPGFDFERLDTFFLGREVDIKTGRLYDQPLLFKNRNLTTHAAIIGMTGSGKTGLGIAMIEEAAMDSIPVIVIDPKGDMGNLMLSFPDLSPGDFLPWIDEAAAGQKGLSREEYAEKTAETWKKGLKKWWQGPERIAACMEKAERRIFTPGSTAGEPVSILGGFESPDAEILHDVDALNSLITSTVSGLLALAGMESDPLKGRENLLLSTIFLYFWRRNQGLSLESLIGSIINPPFQKLGVLPLETIYPSAERMKLAMVFNTVLASPGFSSWLQGIPLDIGRILYGENGRPRISIFSLPHLGEPERMFFVTVLLNRFLSWLRMQQGSTSVRCLLYMDEISGYFPPVASPPSKRPMLMLLKQARAYGAGIILSTQNPADLDYKGLSNIGTWFIGRLQTRQDQDKVLEGLETASADTFDKSGMRTALSSLPGRTFLLRSVHLNRHLFFRTRWVMSYLRGPLTLENIKRLKNNSGRDEKPLYSSQRKTDMRGQALGMESLFPGKLRGGELSKRPILAAGITQLFHVPPVPAERFLLRPYLALTAKVRFFDVRRGIDIIRHESAKVFMDENFVQADWKTAEPLDIEASDLAQSPPEEASYFSLPQSLLSSRSLAPFARSWSDFLYRSCRLKLFRVKSLKLESRPGESPEDFRARMAAILRTRKQDALDKLETRYEKRYLVLEDRLARARSRLEKEKGDVAARGVDTAVSFGVAILGALFGRRTLSGANASRAGRGIRSAGRMLREKEDVQRARASVERAEEALRLLARGLDKDTQKISQKYSPENYPVEGFFIKPRRTDVYEVKSFILWEALLDIA